MKDEQRFSNLFASDDSQTFLIGDIDPESGKRLTKSQSANLGPPTDELFSDHLAGAPEKALAVLPRLFGVIDIDPENYSRFDPVKYCTTNKAKINAANLIATFSKSGGVRLWRIMSERVSPDAIKSDLELWAADLPRDGIKNIDIFPVGKSKIMLPFYGDECGLVSGAPMATFFSQAKNKARLETDLRESDA